VTEPLVAPNRDNHDGVYFLRFTEGGDRLRVRVGSSVFVWYVPEATVSAPRWLADLAEALGGQHLGDGMQVESVSPRKLFDLRDRLTANTNTNADSFTSWSKWFFADRAERNISPSSKITVQQYIENCTKESNTKSFDLDAAEQLASGDAELLLRISKARERLQQIAKATALHEQAEAFTGQGNRTEAEAAYREALAIRRKLFGNEDRDVAVAIYDLATLLEYGQSKFEEAESLYREALAIRRKLYSDEHYQVADTLDALARVLEAQGKFAGAEGALREELAIRFGSIANKGRSPYEIWYPDSIARLAFASANKASWPRLKLSTPTS